MASQQAAPPKVYLRNNVYSTSDAPSGNTEQAFSPVYGQAPMTYQAGDTTVYIRQPTQQQSTAPYPVVDTLGVPYYGDESTLRGASPFSELSNDSRSKTPRSHRHHHHGHAHGTASRQRRQRIEEPDGYWILPHGGKNQQSRSQSSMAGTYVTPGGRFLSRTPKKHTAGVQFAGTEQTLGGGGGGDATTADSMTDLNLDAEDYMQNSQCLPDDDANLTVSHFAA